MSVETNSSRAVESPDTVHGRLMESVHIAGYSVARAVDEFEWLLDEDRWRRVGPGYDDIRDFLSSLKLDEFKLGIEQRKGLAKKLEALGSSQRATAQALGVSKDTVAGDLGKRGDNSPSQGQAQALEQVESTESGDNSPAWFQDDIDPAKLGKGRSERKKRDADSERRRIEADREAARAVTEVTVDVRRGDFREVLADLSDVDAIITDPPYPSEFLPLLADLAAWSDKVLKPDGVLVVLMGQTHLPEVYRLLDGHRPYRWTACYMTPGAGYSSYARGLQSNWKPLLVYGGGPRFVDVFTAEVGDTAAKTHHKWGQDYSAFSSIVQAFTEPGATVADPFMGSGTTLLAAKLAGRHAIGADVDADHVATARERLNG